jgi:hypothetical protein
MMGHVAGSCVVLLIAAACSSSERARTRRQDDAAFAGAAPTEVRHVRAVGHIELVESSAAAMSIAQPGLFFTINDSGNDAVLFALDTTGANRGAWKVLGARNRDWEAAAVGPCSTSESSSPAREGWCVYVGDVGDNGEAHRESTIYRVPEPAAGRQGTADTITTEHLRFRYAD